MSLKDFLSGALVALVEQNHLCNFSRGHYGEPSCEVILNSDQWFRRCPLKKKKFTDGQMTDRRQ